MGFIKRHMWLVATLGAMVVLSALCVVFLFLWQGRYQAYAKVLEKSKRQLSGGAQYYNEEAAEKLKGAARFREEKHKELLNYLRQVKWTELIPHIFPKYKSDTQVYNFKIKYKGALQDFMKTLGAASFEPGKAPPLTRVQMYVRSDAFFKDAWIEQTALPPTPEMIMKKLRDSQDDLWLQETIVGAIKRTNDLYFAAMGTAEDNQTVATAVVKELHEIRIGAQYLPTNRFMGGSRGRRFLYAGEKADEFAGLTLAPSTEEEQVDKRAPTLTGRASDNCNRRYFVLPFRVTAIVDAGNYAELIRQLTGTRSFITILDVNYEVIPEVESAYRSFGLMRSDQTTRHEVYGRDRPLARVTLWGESLLFRIDGGRPTVSAPESESGKS